MSKMSEAFTELQDACTRNDAGVHFTERMDFEILNYLENQGLIEINRPVHEWSGIPYSQEHWSLLVSDLGNAVLKSGEMK